MARHDNLKIYNTFYRKKLYVLFGAIPVIVWWYYIGRYYIERGGTNMNYAKKSRKENMIR